jgi:hypothetical protein
VPLAGSPNNHSCSEKYRRATYSQCRLRLGGRALLILIPVIADSGMMEKAVSGSSLPTQILPRIQKEPAGDI